MRVGNGPMTHAVQAERTPSRRRTMRKLERTHWKHGGAAGIYRYLPGPAPAQRVAARENGLRMLRNLAGTVAALLTATLVGALTRAWAKDSA